MSQERLAWWGWMVNLVLLLLFVTVAGYGWWKDTLVSLEETKLRQEMQRLKTANAFTRAQLRSIRQKPDPPTPNPAFLGNRRDQIYAGIAAAAQQSGMVIRKLVVGATQQQMIPVTLEMEGDYPAVQALLNGTLQPNWQLQPERLELSQNPEPGKSLILALQMRIPAGKGGGE